ncbi:MAG: phosphoribosylformylglycinamidine synthase subunit PurQ, partial [Patescibacteria group bacterium]
MKPNVIVLKADGINRDEEMAYAFKLAGADVKIVHVNQLRSGEDKMSNYNILALPGGFAYGDDIVSGKILAIELTSFLGTEMKKFIERKNTAIIGVCNGFQVLVRTGLLPFRKIG